MNERQTKQGACNKANKEAAKFREEHAKSAKEHVAKLCEEKLHVMGVNREVSDEATRGYKQQS